MYRSPRPDVEIPNVTLTDLVIEGARQYGNATALLDASTGERVTYAELRTEVHHTAAGLAALDIGPGTVVGLMSHNQPAFAIALHGALATGAAVTPINPAYTAGEAAAQITRAGARLLIAAREVADKAREIAEHVHILGDPFRSEGPPPKVDLDPATTVALLPFSSGTTGTAKGVRLTHRNLVANLVQTRAGWCLGPADVQAAVLPFFHCYGMSIILNSGLLAGSTVVTFPRFDLAGYLAALAEHHVTRAYLVPPMVLALANAPEVAEHDLSALRYVLCGAAPLDVDVTERAQQQIGCLIRQGYGMTEASPGTHQVFDDEFSTVPAGSIGHLSPNTQARLVEPGTDTDVKDGEPGELLIRGPQVMAGYLNDPDATEHTITDGWLHTGDLVRVDRDGVFWVVDRLKELIKYKGYQIAPAELESVLLTHPDVADAAVVGVPHPVGGEAPKAFVVTTGTVTADDLMGYVAERVAPYKKIRAVEFVDEIPKSPAGKILRRVLKNTPPSSS